MPCTPFRLPGGVSGIVCTRGGKSVRRCSVAGCNAPSGFQCDYPVRPGKTCDRHLCAKHAHEIGVDVHRCPDHVDAAAQTELFEEQP
ncbi:hypothetical protein ADM96_20145 [Burkholderia sp. ST111]|nr:hypothetical protein ADM96_20145 [Burkholderia sp. ST111]